MKPESRSSLLGTAIFLGLIHLCLFASVTVSADEKTQTLSFRFIGNEAFEISDGETTLLTDFPYESGAFGYMAYKFGDVQPKGKVICLITHEHRDHFDEALFLENKKWSVFAAPGITKGLPKERVIPFKKNAKIGAIEIQAIKTPHTPDHHSYIVTWHGVRMYFSGDTEEPESLLAAKNLDIAFVSPWLLNTVAKTNRRIDATKVIVYHHKASQRIVRYQEAFVPDQGDTFEAEVDVE